MHLNAGPHLHVVRPFLEDKGQHSTTHRVLMGPDKGVAGSRVLLQSLKRCTAGLWGGGGWVYFEKSCFYFMFLDSTYK